MHGYAYYYLMIIIAEITCEQLIDPDNGIVDLTGINVGSRATYSCDKGFDLTGGQFIRTCQPNGQWSGDAPSCESTYQYNNIDYIITILKINYFYSIRNYHQL